MFFVEFLCKTALMLCLLIQIECICSSSPLRSFEACLRVTSAKKVFFHPERSRGVSIGLGARRKCKSNKWTMCDSTWNVLLTTATFANLAPVCALEIWSDEFNYNGIFATARRDCDNDNSERHTTPSRLSHTFVLCNHFVSCARVPRS